MEPTPSQDSTPPSPVAQLTLVEAIAPANGGPGPDSAAQLIIRNHVLWSLGAGMIPVPVADLAAVTAIQMDALRQLAELYKIDFTADLGKRFVTALSGSSLARVGASAIKAIPGVGTVLGGLSMSALSAASTYAVCQVALHHFKTHGDFLNVKLDWARQAYADALAAGRDFVHQLRQSGADQTASQVFDSIRQLQLLKDQGVLTEEEFTKKKTQLLERIC